MIMNVPKAQVGLGTTGIGDNFARQRLLMAKQAGYVASTPSPFAKPGTALQQYRGVTPLLSKIAQAQGVKGIPGLLRQGMTQGRPPMAPPMQGMGTATPNYASAMAGRAGQLPLPVMGQPGAAPQGATTAPWSNLLPPGTGQNNVGR